MTSVKKIFQAVKDYFSALSAKEERNLSRKTFQWHNDEHYDYR